MPLRAADAALALPLGLVLHVTVLVPFAPEPSHADRAALAEIAAAAAPFEVRLRRFERFAIEDPNVLWLAPEPVEPFLALIGAVVERFPANPPLEGRYAEIVPHATVATGTAGELDRVEARLAPLLPLTDRAAELELVRVADPVVAEDRWPLGP